MSRSVSRLATMLHNAHNVTVSDGHRVRYKRGGAGVGGVLASQPLTPHTPYFEVTVENPGQRATIAIGVSCRGYPLSAQPGSYLVDEHVSSQCGLGRYTRLIRCHALTRPAGWRRGSVGFHCDDGKVFAAGATRATGPTSGRGDVIGCGAEFAGTLVPRSCALCSPARAGGVLPDDSRVEQAPR